MVFDHMVKRNGFYYAAGEDVPDEIESPASVPGETDEERAQYGKTQINKMTTDEVRDFAAKLGIEGAEGKTGAELKKILIQMIES